MKGHIEAIKREVQRDVRGAYGRVVPGKYRVAGDRTAFRCPLHVEKTGSFTVFGDGHWKCFGCGEHGDFLDLVGRLNPGLTGREINERCADILGLSLTQAGSPRTKSRSGDPSHDGEEPVGVGDPSHKGPADDDGDAEVTRTPYPIRDRDGNVVATHVRKQEASGKKTFVWERDGKPGLGGLAVKDLPLYNTELLPTLEPGATVIVTEGEKAADALTGFGLCALGTVTGASACPSPEVLACLKGFDVVLFADHDTVGHSHMQKVAAACPHPSRLLCWTEGPKGADAHDLLATEQFATPDDFTAWVDGQAEAWVRPRRQRVTTVAKMAEKLAPTSWEWLGWLPRGYITIIAGQPGVGKSGLALDLVRRYLTGLEWPDGAPADPGDASQRRALWLETEDSHGMLRDRCRDWSAPLDRIVLWGEEGLDRPNLDADDIGDALREAVQDDHIGLVVLDTLAGAHYQDENSSSIKATMQTLTGLAQAENIPVIAVHHLRKQHEKETAEIHLDRLRGSSAIGASARVVIAAAPLPDAEECLRVQVIKTNFGRKPRPLRSTLTADGPVYEPWEGDEDGGALREPRLEQCVRVLLTTLATAGGRELDAAELAAATGLHGFSKPLTTDARALLRSRGQIVERRAGRNQMARLAPAGGLLA